MIDELKVSILNILKWLGLSLTIGFLCGGASSIFAKALKFVISLRQSYSFLFYCLPLSGLLIVFLYQKFGQKDGGTTQVLSTIKAQDEVPLRSAPLIFVSTCLTHFVGASAGREGAAIQLGGSIANQIGRWLHLDEEDTHTMIMAGMSAAFSAVFGTPMAASIFALEITSVGVMYYSALFPCIVSSLTASIFAASFGIDPESFHVSDIPSFDAINGFKIFGIALLCGLVSILFCIILKHVAILLNTYFKNPYFKIVIASGVVIGITCLLRTTDFMGAGNELIERAIENGQARPYDFLLKMILTALCMRSGFRGGEIVPSFCIGATLGCVLGTLFDISPSLAAACGMIALFCSMTNCPITSILIAFELFGFDGVSYFLLSVGISYAISGYYGLYKDQTIVYSKYKAKFVNQHTKV